MRPHPGALDTWAPTRRCRTVERGPLPKFLFNMTGLLCQLGHCIAPMPRAVWLDENCIVLRGRAPLP